MQARKQRERRAQRRLCNQRAAMHRGQGAWVRCAAPAAVEHDLKLTATRCCAPHAARLSTAAEPWPRGREWDRARPGRSGLKRQARGGKCCAWPSARHAPSYSSQDGPVIDPPPMAFIIIAPIMVVIAQRAATRWGAGASLYCGRTSNSGLCSPGLFMAQQPYHEAYRELRKSCSGPCREGRREGRRSWSSATSARPGPRAGPPAFLDRSSLARCWAAAGSRCATQVRRVQAWA